jgi:glycosyltransferase involved in cell wall biosynthesis
MLVELTIVMPCLNEAETLAACIRKAQSYLERSGLSGEIVIGDNGSTDGSQQITANSQRAPSSGWIQELIHE